MARRTKITARIDLATLLDLRDRTDALAANGVFDMQMARMVVRKMLSSVSITVDIPVNGTITQAEAARLAKIAENDPAGFIPAFVRAVASESVEKSVATSSTTVHTGVTP
jgi:hypothetical protein